MPIGELSKILISEPSKALIWNIKNNATQHKNKKEGKHYGNKYIKSKKN